MSPRPRPSTRGMPRPRRWNVRPAGCPARPRPPSPSSVGTPPGPPAQLRKADRDLRVQVGSVALEALVAADVQDDVEVPGRAPPRRRLAPADEAQRRPVLDARGDVDLQRSSWGHARPVAGRAGLAHDPPLAAADRAGGRDHQEALRVHDLPAPAAMLAGLGLGARRRAGPLHSRRAPAAVPDVLVTPVNASSRVSDTGTSMSDPRAGPRPPPPMRRRRGRRRCRRTRRRCRPRRGSRRRSGRGPA